MHRKSFFEGELPYFLSLQLFSVSNISQSYLYYTLFVVHSPHNHEDRRNGIRLSKFFPLLAVNHFIESIFNSSNPLTRHFKFHEFYLFDNCIYLLKHEFTSWVSRSARPSVFTASKTNQSHNAWGSCIVPKWY